MILVVSDGRPEEVCPRNISLGCYVLDNDNLYYLATLMRLLGLSSWNTGIGTLS
jgi:hypothetical protein